MSKWSVSFSHAQTRARIEDHVNGFWGKLEDSIQSLDTNVKIQRCRACEYARPGQDPGYIECTAEPGDKHIVFVDKSSQQEEFTKFTLATRNRVSTGWNKDNFSILIFCSDDRTGTCNHSEKCAHAGTIINRLPKLYGDLEYNFTIPNAGFSVERTSALCVHFPQWVAIPRTIDSDLLNARAGRIVAASIVLAQNQLELKNATESATCLRDEFPKYIWSGRALYHALEARGLEVLGSHTIASFRGSSDFEISLQILESMRTFEAQWLEPKWQKPFDNTALVMQNAGLQANAAYKITGEAVRLLWDQIPIEMEASASSSNGTRVSAGVRAAKAIAWFTRSLGKVADFRERLNKYCQKAWNSNSHGNRLGGLLLNEKWMAGAFACFCVNPNSVIWSEQLRFFSLLHVLEFEISNDPAIKQLIDEHVFDLEPNLREAARVEWSGPIDKTLENAKEFWQQQFKKSRLNLDQHEAAKLVDVLANALRQWSIKEGPYI